MPSQPVWSVYCDGSAVPNPGRMGMGAVLVAPDGTSRVPLSHTTGGVGCNNEAELRALLLALAVLSGQCAGASAPKATPAATPETAHAAAPLALHIYTDNRLLVDQLGSPGATPVARLAPLFDEARRLLHRFDPVQVQWIPRHHNREADALARAALGLAPKLTAPAGQKKARKPRKLERPPGAGCFAAD